MNLSNPITIQPPTIIRADGEVRVQNPIIIKELSLIIIDDVKNKNVIVKIKPCPFPLVVWTKQDYDTVGDYTQTQLENRVLELLGDDIKSSLEKLFSG